MSTVDKVLASHAERLQESIEAGTMNGYYSALGALANFLMSLENDAGISLRPEPEPPTVYLSRHIYYVTVNKGTPSEILHEVLAADNREAVMEAVRIHGPNICTVHVGV